MSTESGHTSLTRMEPYSTSSFTGKEKDEETGYGYFGARYMDHELMTMWLSVDPMADKYPNISPYAYCAWNPVKLVDPDGLDWYEYIHPKTHKIMVHWTDCKNQEELNDELKGSNTKGNYLGVTVETPTQYFGLMGDIVDKNENKGEHYRLVKDLDCSIINRALASNTSSSEPVDFSDVFRFEYGAGSINSRSGYSYAGGEAGIAMNDKRDSEGNKIGMMGRFNDMRKMSGRSLSGPLSKSRLDPPRYSINGVNLNRKTEIAAISFAKSPDKADRFERIYGGLKGRSLIHSQRINHSWSQQRYK